MKRDWVTAIVLGLALVGLLIFVGSYLVLGQVSLGGNIALGLAGVALVVYVFLNPQEVLGGIKSRQARYGGNTLLMTLIFIGIVVAVNFLSMRHSKRWDMTSDKKYSLAPETVEVLQNLPSQVTVLHFSSSQSGGQRSDAGVLLDEYRSRSSKVQVQTIDPDAQPSLARQYSAYDGMIVLLVGDRTITVNSATESDITAGLLKATRTQQLVVYFTGGHGEADLSASTQTGFSTIQTGLNRDGFEVKPLMLATTTTVPADASLVVVAGPQASFQPREAEALRSYLARGGRMLVMVEPSLNKDRKLGDVGLGSLLSEWGITLRDDLVLDLLSSQVADPGVTIAAKYGNSPITNKLSNMATVFPGVRSLDLAQTAPAQVMLTPLVYTSEQSWGASDLTVVLAAFGQGRFPSVGAQDAKGPLVIAAAAENSQTKARLVVFGSAMFAGNGMTSQPGNYDLFLNSVNWLAEQDLQITIRAKSFTTRQLIPSRVMLLQVFGISVILMPLAVLVVGVIVWWRRR